MQSCILFVPHTDAEPDGVKSEGACSSNRSDVPTSEGSQTDFEGRSTARSNHMPSQMDAISMLKADHEKVRGLLSQLENSSERSTSKREALLQQIAEEIEINTT